MCTHSRKTAIFRLGTVVTKTQTLYSLIKPLTKGALDHKKAAGVGMERGIVWWALPKALRLIRQPAEALQLNIWLHREPDTSCSYFWNALAFTSMRRSAGPLGTLVGPWLLQKVREEVRLRNRPSPTIATVTASMRSAAIL